MIRFMKQMAVKSEFKEAEYNIEEISCIQHFNAFHALILMSGFCYKNVLKKYLSSVQFSSLFL
jgi:hypothetical protein